MHLRILAAFADQKIKNLGEILWLVTNHLATHQNTLLKGQFTENENYVIINSPLFVTNLYKDIKYICKNVGNQTVLGHY